MAKFDAFVHEGKRYDRDGFRELLRQQMQAARDDPAHPYSDSRHPQHAAAVADMRNAYRWLAGEISETEESEIAGAFNEALRGETEVTDALLPFQEIAQIVGTPEGRTALQRARTGLPLDERQKAIVARHDELEALNNAQAYKERAVKTAGKMRPYIPGDAMAWITNPHKEQRRQLAAEWKAKTLADPSHDYWHGERGAVSKSARLAMKAAYEAAETGEINSVHINPADGSISESEE